MRDRDNALMSTNPLMNRANRGSDEMPSILSRTRKTGLRPLSTSAMLYGP